MIPIKLSCVTSFVLYSVDRGSVAEKCGIRVGDQILEANGKPFENVLHREAVEFFKSQENFILTVKVFDQALLVFRNACLQGYSLFHLFRGGIAR